LKLEKFDFVKFCDDICCVKGLAGSEKSLIILFSHFDIDNECDKGTEGQTDRQTELP